MKIETNNFAKRMRNVVLRLFIYYVGACGLVFFFQNKLLYIPTKISASMATSRVESLGGKTFSRNEGNLHAYLFNDLKPEQDTVLVFHGNAGEALSRTYYVDALKRFGFRVVLAEYPTYGPRSGEQGEESFVADAVATAKALKERYSGKLYLWGESMGCGVAAAVIREMPNDIAGAALLTPWDTLKNMAQARYWFLPARFLCRDSYNSVANIAAYEGPIVFAIAGKDEVIPNRLSQKLYDSFAGPKYLVEFPNSGHNDWPGGAHEAWWQNTVGFWRKSD